MKRSICNTSINYYAPPLVWVGLIFFFSSLQFSSQGGIPGLDKVAHFMEYLVLTILVYRLFLSGFRVEKKLSGLLSFFLVFLFSITDEFHQSFIPTREVSLFDILSDTIGATVAIFCLWKLLPKAPKRLSNLAKKLGLI